MPMYMAAARSRSLATPSVSADREGVQPQGCNVLEWIGCAAAVAACGGISGPGVVACLAAAAPGCIKCVT
jgi:hypothetical protein